MEPGRGGGETIPGKDMEPIGQGSSQAGGGGGLHVLLGPQTP